MYAGQVEYDLYMFFCFKNQTKDNIGSNLLSLKIESSVQQISSPNCSRNVQKTMAHPSLSQGRAALLHGRRCGPGGVAQRGAAPGDLRVHGLRAARGLQRPGNLVKA